MLLVYMLTIVSSNSGYHAGLVLSCRKKTRRFTREVGLVAAKSAGQVLKNL